jgi:hypothetical protein
MLPDHFDPPSTDQNAISCGRRRGREWYARCTSRQGAGVVVLARGVWVHIFFDVDYTIQGVDGTIRPGVDELFSALVAEGHHVYIWSGTGSREDDVARHGLDDRVSGICVKPRWDFEAGLKELAVPVRPDFVVDDHAEVVRHFGGVHVSPYMSMYDA